MWPYHPGEPAVGNDPDEPDFIGPRQYAAPDIPPVQMPGYIELRPGEHLLGDTVNATILRDQLEGDLRELLRNEMRLSYHRGLAIAQSLKSRYSSNPLYDHRLVSGILRSTQAWQTAGGATTSPKNARRLAKKRVYKMLFRWIYELRQARSVLRRQRVFHNRESYLRNMSILSFTRHIRYREYQLQVFEDVYRALRSERRASSAPRLNLTQ